MVIWSSFSPWEVLRKEYDGFEKVVLRCQNVAIAGLDVALRSCLLLRVTRFGCECVLHAASAGLTNPLNKSGRRGGWSHFVSTFSYTTPMLLRNYVACRDERAITSTMINTLRMLQIASTSPEHRRTRPYTSPRPLPASCLAKQVPCDQCKPETHQHLPLTPLHIAAG